MLHTDSPTSGLVNVWSDPRRFVKLSPSPKTPPAEQEDHTSCYSSEFPSLGRAINAKVRAAERQSSAQRKVEDAPLTLKRTVEERPSSGEPSPTLSPQSPLSPPRRVEGVLISPQPIESPKSALKRWVDAGRPEPYVYKTNFCDEMQWRAFKRAVGVAASPPSTGKKMKMSDQTMIGSRTYAATLLQKLGLVDMTVQTSYEAEVLSIPRLPPAMMQPSIVQTFKFGTICSAATSWSQNPIEVVSYQHAISA